MCAEKWQEIFPWTLVGSVLWDQHFNDVLSNYVRGKDTRPLCVLCGAGLWASQPRARLLSPSPEKSTLLHSWKNFSGFLALWQWRRRYHWVQTLASLQHFSLIFPAKGTFLACRDCPFCHPQHTADWFFLPQPALLSWKISTTKSWDLSCSICPAEQGTGTQGGAARQATGTLQEDGARPRDLYIPTHPPKPALLPPLLFPLVASVRWSGHLQDRDNWKHQSRCL